LRNGPFVTANNYMFYLKVRKLQLLLSICIEKQAWQSTYCGGFKNLSPFFWLSMKHTLVKPKLPCHCLLHIKKVH